MRVIGGTLGGRRLRAPPGRDTRPTSDRVREAMFSSLADVVPGATVLDLFAGSGALGIEALSRGARFAVLVERNRRTAEVIRSNLAGLGLDPNRAQVHEMTAEAFVAAGDGDPFDLVFCDPPYDVPLEVLSELLEVLRRDGRLRAGAVVVVERDRRDAALLQASATPAFLVEQRRRTYGDTVLVYLRHQEPDL